MRKVLLAACGAVGWLVLVDWPRRRAKSCPASSISETIRDAPGSVHVVSTTNVDPANVGSTCDVTRHGREQRFGPSEQRHLDRLGQPGHRARCRAICRCPGNSRRRHTRTGHHGHDQCAARRGRRLLGRASRSGLHVHAADTTAERHAAIGRDDDHDGCTEHARRRRGKRGSRRPEGRPFRGRDRTPPVRSS